MFRISRRDHGKSGLQVSTAACPKLMSAPQRRIFRIEKGIVNVKFVNITVQTFYVILKRQTVLFFVYVFLRSGL